MRLYCMKAEQTCRGAEKLSKQTGEDAVLDIYARLGAPADDEKDDFKPIHMEVLLHTKHDKVLGVQRIERQQSQTANIWRQ